LVVGTLAAGLFVLGTGPLLVTSGTTGAGLLPALERVLSNGRLFEVVSGGVLSGVFVLDAAGGGVAGREEACFAIFDMTPLWCERLAVEMERISDSAKKMVAEYFVIFVKALPVPAPNKASVAAPPNAVPIPASFLGNWIRINRIRNKQLIARTTVIKPRMNPHIISLA
jgi:hypothetical protein